MFFYFSEKKLRFVPKKYASTSGETQAQVDSCCDVFYVAICWNAVVWFERRVNLEEGGYMRTSETMGKLEIKKKCFFGV